MEFLSRFWKKKVVTVPSVLQMEAVECGAAALGMILVHFGRYNPLEELRVECGFSRDGSKASNVLKAARKFGLEAKGFTMEPGDLVEYPLPMIIFWNFNHFVVLEGFKGGRAYLNDPAKGPRDVSMEEFDGSFTGIALTFKKTPQFRTGGHPPSIVASLASRAEGISLGLMFIILAGLFLVIPGLLVPAFSTIFVDNILIQGTPGWIKPLLLAMGLTALVRYLLTWLQQYYLLRINTRLALTGSRNFMTHVLQLPMEFFLQRMPAEIGNRVASNDRVAQLLSGQTATSIVNIIMVVFYVPIMLYIDQVLALAALAFAMLNLLLLRIVSRKRTLLNQRIQMDLGKAIGVCGNGIQSIETLKATGGENDFFSAWKQELIACFCRR